MARTWTDAQKEAIYARGRGVLVSAAAGSGKTSVLTERVISLLKEGYDIDRLLIVTYTNAAAAEMKSRIKERLASLIAENPEDNHLRRQILLLPSANISTMHAFCLNLARENYEKTGISANAKIGDSDEVDALKHDAAVAVVRDHIRAEDEELFSMLSPGKNDEGIIENIIKVYEYIASYAFMDECISSLENLLDPEIPFINSIYYKVLKEKTLADIYYYISLEENIKREAEEISLELSAEVEATVVPDILLLNKMAGFLENDKYGEFLESLNESFVRLAAIKQSNTFKQRLKNARNIIKKQIASLKTDVFSYSEEEYSEDMKKIYPAGKLFFSMVRKFISSYSELKKERDIIDFSDVEHLTIDLLYEKDGVPSLFAKELAENYDEIMVDEFQDTNETQYSIFRALSRGEQNLFTVGDVKQSIYRFRLADPTIFLNRKESCSDAAPAPKLITLNNNFRSVKGVCDTVNEVFASIMSPAVGEMIYGEEEKLYPKDNERSETEIIIAENECPESEALVVLDRVRELIKNGITVGEKHIPISYEDIAILMSTRKTFPIFSEVFTKAGIPIVSDENDNFLKTRECDSAISLLRAIDNPCYDMHFAASVLSPVFGFTPDDLVELKTQKKKSLYEAAVYSKNPRMRAFAENLKRYRSYSFTLSALELIKKIFYETDFVEIFEAFSSSSRANLMKLLSLADGEVSLLEFLRRTERYKNGKTAAEPASASGTVRMMTIHGSKGLEFPVCIVCDNGRIRRQRNDQPVLVHKNLGICMKVRDTERHISYTTAPMEAVKIVKNSELLSERMRVLYVAMTRGQKKLIITAAVKGREKYLNSFGNSITDNAPTPSQVMSAKSDLEWVLLGIMRSGGELKKGIDAKILLPDPAVEDAREEIKEAKIAPSEDILKILKESSGFRYENSGIEKIPVRLSVSDIAKKGKTKSFISRPAFVSADEASAAEKGTAMHKFMQYADYAAAHRSIEAEMERLADKEFLSEKEISLCDKAKLSYFFNSDLYKRIAAADEVQREYSFMYAKNAGDIIDVEERFKGEKVLIQGIADCIIIENGFFTVIDYKTDNVKTEDVLIERYRTQLELYCEALEEKLGISGAGSIIYSFALEKAIEL